MPTNGKGGHDEHQQSPITSGSLFSMRAFNADKDLPIVYTEKYNMYMIGIELMHQFDTKKYTKMADHLSNAFLDTPYARHRHYDEHQLEGADTPLKPRRLRFLKPNRPVNRHELEIHHSPDYVQAIHEDKSLVARITETWLLNLIPACALETRLLTPIKWQVAGTIYAFHLAMQHGWAINLGGGFHQGSADNGETFCLFSDIMLSIKYVWRKHPLQKFMIIDLDAHQATGVERDITELESKKRKMVHMLDMFNGTIQPPDSRADLGIDTRIELGRFTGDNTYLSKLRDGLTSAFGKFKPTMIVYVAGQDVLKDDQLGLMNITDEALMKRDELVFSWATERQKCSIVMLLGGGYLTRGAKIQADSIRNLYAKNLIWGGYRSGSRSLSRPRKQEASKYSESNADVLSKSSKSRSGKKARVIHVAPISKRLIRVPDQVQQEPAQAQQRRNHNHRHQEQPKQQKDSSKQQPPPSSAHESQHMG